MVYKPVRQKTILDAKSKDATRNNRGTFSRYNIRRQKTALHFSVSKQCLQRKMLLSRIEKILYHTNAM